MAKYKIEVRDTKNNTFIQEYRTPQQVADWFMKIAYEIDEHEVFGDFSYALITIQNGAPGETR